MLCVGCRRSCWGGVSLHAFVDVWCLCAFGVVRVFVLALVLMYACVCCCRFVGYVCVCASC